MRTRTRFELLTRLTVSLWTAAVSDRKLELLGLLLAVGDVREHLPDLRDPRELTETPCLPVLPPKLEEPLLEHGHLRPQSHKLLVPLMCSEVVVVQAIVDLALFVDAQGEGGPHESGQRREALVLVLQQGIGLLEGPPGGGAQRRQHQGLLVQQVPLGFQEVQGHLEAEVDYISLPGHSESLGCVKEVVHYES